MGTYNRALRTRLGCELAPTLGQTHRWRISNLRRDTLDQIQCLCMLLDSGCTLTQCESSHGLQVLQSNLDSLIHTFIITALAFEGIPWRGFHHLKIIAQTVKFDFDRSLDRVFKLDSKHSQSLSHLSSASIGGVIEKLSNL